MRDCAATVEVYFTEGQIRKKDNAEAQRARRSAEKKVTSGNPRPSVLLFGGGGFGGGVCVFLLEALDTAGGVDEFLLAGEERMAARADFDAQHLALHSRASLEGVAAGAMHRYGMIVRVNTGFHEAPFCRVRSARQAGQKPDHYSRVARSRSNP
jgi:hypothetical protein